MMRIGIVGRYRPTILTRPVRDDRELEIALAANSLLRDDWFPMSSRQRQKTKRANDSDYRALAEFRYHIRRYLEFSDRAAKSSGVEPKQYQLLLAIRSLSDDSEAIVGTLAEQLRVRHHSAVELINRAETNGLVQRSRVGTRVFVRLTKKGKRILAKAVEERLPELRAAAPNLLKALEHLTRRSRS